MFVRSESKNKGLQTVRLNLGQYFDQEKPEDVYIVLQETTIEQSMNLAKDPTSESMVKKFTALLPVILIEHNLYEEPGVLMETSEVVKLIQQKSRLLHQIMKEYTSALFPAPPKQNEDK